MTRRFCPNCGAALKFSVQKFCTTCGAALPEPVPDAGQSARVKDPVTGSGMTVLVIVGIILLVIGVGAVLLLPDLTHTAGSSSAGLSEEGTMYQCNNPRQVHPLPGDNSCTNDRHSGYTCGSRPGNHNDSCGASRFPSHSTYLEDPDDHPDDLANDRDGCAYCCLRAGTNHDDYPGDNAGTPPTSLKFIYERHPGSAVY